MEIYAILAVAACAVLGIMSWRRNQAERLKERLVRVPRKETRR